MKTLTRIVVTVLGLACIAFLAIAMFKPQLGEELQTKLEDIYHQRSEVIEVSPVRSLEIAYDFPLTDEDALDYWIEPTSPDTVFTWFRDLGRDLWLPFRPQLLLHSDILLLPRQCAALFVSHGESLRNLPPLSLIPCSSIKDAAEFDAHPISQMLSLQGRTIWRGLVRTTCVSDALQL